MYGHDKPCARSRDARTGAVVSDPEHGGADEKYAVSIINRPDMFNWTAVGRAASNEIGSAGGAGGRTRQREKRHGLVSQTSEESRLEGWPRN